MKDIHVFIYVVKLSSGNLLYDTSPASWLLWARAHGGWEAIFASIDSASCSLQLRTVACPVSSLGSHQSDLQCSSSAFPLFLLILIAYDILGTNFLMLTKVPWIIWMTRWCKRKNLTLVYPMFYDLVDLWIISPLLSMASSPSFVTLCERGNLSTYMPLLAVVEIHSILFLVNIYWNCKTNMVKFHKDWKTEKQSISPFLQIVKLSPRRLHSLWPISEFSRSFVPGMWYFHLNQRTTGLYELSEYQLLKIKMFFSL